MAAILIKIDTLYKDNEEIFGMMEASNEARPRYCSLKCNGIDPCDLDKEVPPQIVATVTEFEQPEDWPAFRDGWRFTLPLRKDFGKYIGGQNLNWDASTWEDIKKLNTGIKEAAQDYLEDHKDGRGEVSEKVSATLNKFLANMEIVNTNLKRVQEQVTGKSHREEIQAAVDQALKHFNDVLIKYHAHLRCDGLFQKSLILEANHQRLLSSWYPGRWVPIYQGTRHGMNAAAFHTQVDGKGPTITVIKCAGNIFGGHVRVPWASHGDYVNDATASLFSVKSSLGIQPERFPCTRAQHAVYHNAGSGPTFGGGFDITCFSCHDGGRSYSNFGHSYHNTTGQNGHVLIGGQQKNFNPEEIEVFAVA